MGLAGYVVAVSVLASSILPVSILSGIVSRLLGLIWLHRSVFGRHSHHLAKTEKCGRGLRLVSIGARLIRGLMDRIAIRFFMWPVYLPHGIEWTGYNGDTPNHPCEKPTELMAWLLLFCDPAWAICDPFMGSGTTLVAAKRLGRKAIGIELEEKYCEIAAKRLAQGALDLFGAESA